MRQLYSSIIGILLSVINPLFLWTAQQQLPIAWSYLLFCWLQIQQLESLENRKKIHALREDLVDFKKVIEIVSCTTIINEPSHFTRFLDIAQPHKRFNSNTWRQILLLSFFYLVKSYYLSFCIYYMWSQILYSYCNLNR